MRASGYEYKSLNRAVGKAIHDYDMIQDGERILVGLSGGADSLTLAWLLAERRRRVRVRYELEAVYVDPGFEGGAGGALRPFCDRLEIPLRIEFTDFGLRGHSPANRENPCFLCARLRRQRMFEIAAERRCTKLALGHNKDDLIETLFLNMCFSGEISTMRPAQVLFEGRFTVIRPLAYAEAALIRRFAGEYRLPVVENTCPSATSSRRSEIKSLLQDLYRRNRKIKGNLFRSMRRVKPEYLLK
ncbi:MAG: tRNA 2-thiocytidine(32) synthetase TtcA [Desulfobacterales bacterium]|nr:tRNA 2-thiocytidine(32) synthetase TtcA [Desulfobacterales bacterium]